MTWIKFSGFLTSPLSAFGTNLWSCTSTTMSDFKVPPLPQSRDHLCMVRYCYAVAMTYRLHDYLSGKRLHNSLPAASTVRIEFALVRNLPCAGSWHCIFRKANCLWSIFPSSSPLAFTSKNGCASSFIQNIVSQYHCTNVNFPLSLIQSTQFTNRYGRTALEVDPQKMSIFLSLFLQLPRSTFTQPVSASPWLSR